METVIASLISAGLALIGTVITVNASQRKTQEAVENTMKTELAVMNNELKHLREEVEKHNNFAVRVPRLEEAMQAAKDDIHTLQQFHLQTWYNHSDLNIQSLIHF